MTPTVTTAGSRAELKALLLDDVPYGDLTTEALGIGGTPATMTFAARDPVTVALAEDAAAIIELAGGAVEPHARSGDALQSGAAILSAQGLAASTHPTPRRTQRPAPMCW